MQILQAKKENIQVLEEFLMEYEYSCVELCYLVRKNCENVYIVVQKADEFLKAENTINDFSKSEIYGVFSFDGTIHHCFPFFERNKQEFEQFCLCFTEFLNSHEKSVKCINGLAKASNFMLDILEKKNISPFQVNRYNLMVLSKNPVFPSEKLMNDDFIKRCSMNDFDALTNLQKEYLQAEVAPKGKIISDLENNVILKQILKNQICIALVTDDNFAAKANTNAIGWNYVQLGGVYTSPIYRRNSYAWHLVSYLSNLLIKKNKKICLFVNEKNTAAYNLYKKIGFEDLQKFEICYFQ